MNFDGFRDIASNLLTEIETEINKSLNKHKEEFKNNFETEINGSISKATIKIKAEIKNEFKQEFKKYVNDVAKLILEKINSNKSRMKIAEENIDRLQNMPDMTNVISRVTDVEKNFATMKKKIEKQITNAAAINKEDINETMNALKNEMEDKDSLIKSIESKIHGLET